MLANYDRILEEIQREAASLTPAGVAQEEVVTLVMKVVDEVDQHRLRPKSIKKEIQNLVLNFVERHEGLIQ